MLISGFEFLLIAEEGHALHLDVGYGAHTSAKASMIRIGITTLTERGVILSQGCANVECLNVLSPTWGVTDGKDVDLRARRIGGEGVDETVAGKSARVEGVQGTQGLTLDPLTWRGRHQWCQSWEFVGIA
jgi:hypothetical protein